MKTLDELYRDIPIGQDNAITKEELMEKWGVSTERHVRLIIAELRAQDNGDQYVIISLSNKKGFWRSDDPMELQTYKRELMSRAQHTFIPLKKVNRILSGGENVQLEFFPELLSL